MNIFDMFKAEYFKHASEKVDEIICPYCKKRSELWKGFHGGFIVAKEGTFEAIYNDKEDDEND